MVQLASAGEPLVLPSGIKLTAVDFEQHVAPLLSRAGCNAGSCHGASGGQGGFALSLFGFDKSMDHAALLEPDSGRVDVASPEDSLFLQKPTQTIDHEGGMRFARESWEYRLIERWIGDGAKRTPGSGDLRKLEIEPREIVLTTSVDTAKVRVMATFANGQRSDVTPLVRWRVRDETIAAVDQRGVVRRRAPGDTFIIATYNGQPANAHVLAPRPQDGVKEFDCATLTHARIIDRHIFTRLNRLGIQAAPLAADETFLRRVTLATIGQLPSVATIRSFREDPSPDKRTRLIDSLLTHPLHAAMLATRMCEITGSGDAADVAAERRWHAWFRARFADNMPMNEIARGVLSGTTRDERDAEAFIEAEVRRAKMSPDDAVAHFAQRRSLDLYWQRLKVNEEIDVEAITERTAAAFLGIRIECARCHKHPFDRWTVNDHRSLGNVFTQIRYGMSPLLRAGLSDALEARRTAANLSRPADRIPKIREVYISKLNHDLRDPHTQKLLPVKPLGGDRLPASTEPGQLDRRQPFVAWLTGDDNPYFAKNIVNRIWAHYFGLGIVEPVDAFSAGNPPSHPNLLAELSMDFKANGFDVRRLERQILTSAAWQRSSAINGSNQSDRRNFSRAYVRVLPAEVVVDALSCAIGDHQERAVAWGTRRAENDAVKTYFEVFDRPDRKLTCDCERSSDPTLRQTMLLLSDEKLMARIRQGHVQQLAADDKSDDQVIEELFLLTLSRWPDESERAAAAEHLKSATGREGRLADLMWSLLNTREFATRH